MFKFWSACRKNKIMKYSGFAGIDVSKKTLDVSVIKHLSDKTPMHKIFNNEAKGFVALLKWLKCLGHNPSKLFYCLEHTGVYSLEISYWLDSNNYVYYLGNPLDIKRSMGLVRGKSDKADSKHLAHYASKNFQGLKVTKMPSKLLLEIKTLLTHRNMLVEQKRKLKGSEKRLADLPCWIILKY